MTTEERAGVIARFRRDVNMSRADLADWLETDASRAVGDKSGGGESIGHASGRRILDLLWTDPEDYTPADLAHMRRVSGFVARHTAQRPIGDVTDTPWRHSLMNWGHDPLKQRA